MGGRTAADIQSCLLAHGMPASTPVVVMISVSRVNEQRWCGSLAQLAAAVERLGVNEPVLIGVGDAFRSASVNRGEQTAAAPFQKAG